MIAELNGARIRVEQSSARVEIERREEGGIQFICVGRVLGEMDEVRRFLMENGINHAMVRIWVMLILMRWLYRWFWSGLSAGCCCGQ